jgi:hypothetical protein
MAEYSSRSKGFYPKKMLTWQKSSKQQRQYSANHSSQTIKINTLN